LRSFLCCVLYSEILLRCFCQASIYKWY
jgi:hypothetical protein